MACAPAPGCLNVALLAHRRWAEPVPPSHYFQISARTVICTHPLKITLVDQINKSDALLKSFQVKRVICLGRMCAMKISRACALKCHSLTHIIYNYCKKWQSNRLEKCFSCIFFSFKTPLLLNFRFCFFLFLTFFSLILWYMLIFCCRFVAVPKLVWFLPHISTSAKDCIISFNPLIL